VCKLALKETQHPDMIKLWSVTSLALLKTACKRGDWERARMIANKFHVTPEDVRANGNALLRVTCEERRLYTAIWILDHFRLTIEDMRATHYCVLELAIEKRDKCYIRRLKKKYGLYYRYKPAFRIFEKS
jgi:hypothetical protein